MQKELAQRLLSATLKWSDEETEQYLDVLSSFAELKYDEYQQYRPGSRFLESLSAWLNQFDEGADRNTALHFVQNKLVFISTSEMYHLINTVYPGIILPFLKEQAYYICEKESLGKSTITTLIDLLKTKSLFLAMSDGARIDVLRRFAKLEHDQVCVDYDLSNFKYGEVFHEMKIRVDKIDNNTGIKEYIPDGFSHIFLLDDFSGSGVSYLRTEDGEQKGKIKKVIDRLRFTETDGQQEKRAFITPDTKIHIVLYLATEKALNNIKSRIEEIFTPQGISIDISYVQLVSPVDLSEEETTLFKRHYESVKEVVEDKHYCKGNMNCPYLGFDGCSLPLVIHHNTPNNSFPILWAGENALFPRVTRHKEVR